MPSCVFLNFLSRLGPRVTHHASFFLVREDVKIFWGVIFDRKEKNEHKHFNKKPPDFNDDLATTRRV